MVSNVFVLGDLDYNISCVSYHLLWNGQPEMWLLYLGAVFIPQSYRENLAQNLMQRSNNVPPAIEKSLSKYCL